MNKILSLIAVFLFWITAVIAAPILLFLGVVIFLLSVITVTSSFVYEVVYKFLERKKL